MERRRRLLTPACAALREPEWPERTSRGMRASRLRADPTPDSALWERIRQDDAEALGDLFERYRGDIYNFVFRRTGDWASAEDLTSIVFLEAWRRRDKALEGHMVRPWLYGVATHVTRNAHRSRRRYARALARMPVEVSSADFASDSDARLDDELQMSALLEQIKRLPAREREVIALCVWSSLTYEEAALALEIPIGTVRSRLARGKARLRRAIAAADQANRRDVQLPKETS
jgi:RNA polymerase sigma-70 factor (ECF subfamily)